jgi:hypothetical protein
MSGFILPLGDTQGVEVGDLVQVARDALADGHLSFGEVVQLGGLLASKVNRFVQISGQQKQKMVLGIVERACSELLEKHSEDEAYRLKIVAAQDFAKEVLPSVLDLAVSAAKGKLDLGQVKKSCWTALRLALRCASKDLIPLLPTSASAVLKEVAKGIEVVAPVPAAVEEKPVPAPEAELPADEVRPANTVVESNPQEEK